MKDSRVRNRFMRGMLLGMALLFPALAGAQDARWFQVEISIFTNEYFNPDAEIWEAQEVRLLPGTRQLTDLSYLPLDEWEALESGVVDEPEPEPVQEAPSGLPTRDLSGQTTAPENAFVGPPMPELPDIRREPFITLPPSQQDFRDTVRTLDRSPNYRMLFHAAWRQPVRQPARSTAIEVQGGRMIGDISELQGSVRFRFNPNEDRVVIDANIWLNHPGDFAGQDSFQAGGDGIQRIQMIQSRDMRSNEFHYLDHPALGIVVQVKPYTPPPEELPPEEEPPPLPGSLPPAGGQGLRPVQNR